MESFQHNQVKQCQGSALLGIGRKENLAVYFMDGFRLILPKRGRTAWARRR